MSGLALQYPLKEISLSDDLESFVHIIKWFALRYHQHSVRDIIRDKVENSSTEHICLILSLHMQATYFQDVLSGGFHIGGATKIDSFKRKEPEFELNPDHASPAFDKLIRDLHTLCFEHYQLVNWAELARLHKHLVPSTKTKAPSKKPSSVQRQSVAFLECEDRLGFVQQIQAVARRQSSIRRKILSLLMMRCLAFSANVWKTELG